MKTIISLLLALGIGAAYAAEPVEEAGEIEPPEPPTQPEPAETMTPAEAATPAEPADPGKPGEPATPAEPAEPAMPAADVARGQFTSGVQGREPVDDLNSLDTSNETAYFFSEIRGGKGQTIKHQWWHDGEMIAEVPFQVNGDRWRVWSSKDLLPEWTGEWTVRVVDGQGRQLDEQSFNYKPSSVPAPEAGVDPDSPAVKDAEPVAEPKDTNGGI